MAIIGPEVIAFTTWPVSPLISISMNLARLGSKARPREVLVEKHADNDSRENDGDTEQGPGEQRYTIRRKRGQSLSF
jgi:hypothetical protein